MTTIELRTRDRAQMKDNPSSLRVLLVEDSPLIADQISELLEESPCTTPIGIVATENDAISFNAEHEPDLMILDLHLKQGTGFGVLRALSHSTKRPIVVVLTNYALPQYREQALSLGAHHFLDKSSDFGFLCELLDDISRQRATPREPRAAN